MAKGNNVLIVAIAVVVIVGIIGVAYMATNGFQVAPVGGGQITNDAQAKSTITDVGTDVSGISNTLAEIDNTLGQT